MELVILTGMSGAGKSCAVSYFEDKGFFCINNLPPRFIPEVVKMASGEDNSMAGVDKMALVVDVRSRDVIEGFADARTKLEEMEIPYSIIFLEASDNVLVNRYRQTRRKHPLADDMSLTEAIATERKMLQSIRGRAEFIIDTSMLTSSELTKELGKVMKRSGKNGISVFIESFGFMYGLPFDSDDIIDVRFLPNPFWIKELKMFSGNDQPVIDYLQSFEETKEFLDRSTDMFDFMLPRYEKGGRSSLSIGIGCTGGRHRSVYIAEALGKTLEEKGYHVMVHHRDIDRDPRFKTNDEKSE